MASVGATAALDAATLNATLGANSTGLKVSIDNLVVMKATLDAVSPQEMIDPIEQGGWGLDMTLDQAQAIKDALAECPALQDAINASVALARTWGLGVG
jgi:hypothetical protein